MAARLLLIICCFCATLLAAAPANATPPLPGERIAAGVTTAGIDLSGMSVDEAALSLERVRPRLEEGIVTVRVSGLRFRLKTSAAKVTLDATRTAKRALYAGREAAGEDVEVDLAVKRSRRAVRRFTHRIAKRLRRPARDSRVIIRTRRVKVTHSKRGRAIAQRRLIKQVDEALLDPRMSRVIRASLRRPKPKVNARQARRSARSVITIDQSSFKLRLFRNTKLVRSYGVAVGQSKYPTPTGRYSIQSKQVNPVWSVPNSPWAGELQGTTVQGGSAANPLKARWMGVVGGIGIHGTGEGGSIGSRASHGCIRMHVSDVVKLFARVSVGTPVLISR
ncbi:MAG: L,D-transpeptidase family protein [Solirubrobacteraceae bacterium]